MKKYIVLFIVVLAFSCNNVPTLCDCLCDDGFKKENKEECQLLFCEMWGFEADSCKEDVKNVKSIGDKLRLITLMNKAKKECDCTP